jgi:thiamine transporter ThiT
MKNHEKLVKLTLSAFFLALCYTLPFLTGQIQQLGAMLTPMHFPVLLCGFLCGWPYGLAVGLIAPLFRSLTLGMPPLFPNALAMAAELAAYGAVAGLAYASLPRKKGFIYPALLIAMLAGRAVYGLVMLVILGLNASPYGWEAFLSAAFLSSVPGVLLQLLLIPPLVLTLERIQTKYMQ